MAPAPGYVAPLAAPDMAGAKPEFGSANWKDAGGMERLLMVIAWIPLGAMIFIFLGGILYLFSTAFNLCCYRPLKTLARRDAARRSARNQAGTSQSHETAGTPEPPRYTSEPGIELPSYPDAVHE